MRMTDTLTSPQFIALRPYVQHILSSLQKDEVFVFLPKHDLGAMNPRDLPREIYADDGIVFSDLLQRKRGRPARKDKGKKARLALDDLEEVVSKIERWDTDDFGLTYQSAKLTLLENGMTLELESLKEISQATLASLKHAHDTVRSDSESRQGFVEEQA